MSTKRFFKDGEHWVWLNAGAVSLCLIMVVGLLGLIAARGLGHFWPHPVASFEASIDGQKQLLMGEINDSGERFDNALTTYTPQTLFKVGNRELLGMDFKWLDNDKVSGLHYPEQAITVERLEWGNFYGTLTAIKEDGKLLSVDSVDEKREIIARVLARSGHLRDEIYEIERSEIGAINYGLEQIRLRERYYEIAKKTMPAAERAELDAETARYQADYKKLQEKLTALYAEGRRDEFHLKTAAGQDVVLSADKVVNAYFPNAFSLLGKIGFYGHKFWEFLSDDPREANTEGGIFPAIFGTVLMVITMSIIVTPFGVLAAVYLREYATQGWITRTIRIAVNNLAGVPSIVYGVFGLGFFVYFLGGGIDSLFYPEVSPSPMFGTPGLMWASITLALLTLPVVIVSTEEGLARIPRAVREGSLALGATKAETLWRTVLPMASPAMMTGLILAVARAAGEVAPLMLVGVVKLAPTLALDGNAPYLHLERKFMHLGFHIYDVGFQSPNVEAARPLVYATALLLVVVIVLLNLLAIKLRNRLREKYKSLEQ